MHCKRGRDQEILDYQEDTDERRQHIGNTLFAHHLLHVKQLFVFDLCAPQRNARQGPAERIENEVFILLCYLASRIAYEANTEKHSLIMAIKLEYDGAVTWYGERWAARVSRAAEVRGARDKYKLEPLRKSRIQEFPAKLLGTLSQPKSILHMVRLLQLHTVVPSAFESGADLWARFWQLRDTVGVKRWFFIAGRVRSASLRQWAVQYGPLDTLEDVENFRNGFQESLSDVELTFELNALPTELYIRNARLAEQFGTKAFQVWADALSQDSCAKQMERLRTSTHRATEATATVRSTGVVASVRMIYRKVHSAGVFRAVAPGQGRGPGRKLSVQHCVSDASRTGRKVRTRSC